MRLDLHQGSDDWHLWRGSMSISGTGAAVVLGVSPFSTQLQMYNRKHGIEPWPEINDNFVVKRGNRVEKILNKRYQEETGIQVSPACFVHDELTWMRGSLDGITFDESHFCEYKFMGYKQIEDALEYGIPDYYTAQADHYFIITGAATCDFVIGDERQMYIIPHHREEKRLNKLLRAEKAFYKRLVEKKPPPFTDADYELVDTSNRLAVVGALRATQMKLAELKIKEDELKQALIDETPGRSNKGCGATVTRFYATGRIDTAKYLKDNNIEIPETYRGEGRWQYRVSLEKPSED